MKPTQQLHSLGQRLWLDNITRTMLDDGTLKRYIGELAITGLTSNPTIFEKAVGGSDAYDDSLRRLSASGVAGEDLVFSLELEDLTRAADQFGALYEASDHLDGWVSLELAPQLADDAEGSIAAAIDLARRANRPNLFIKIPGTGAGCAAIEESIFAGVPINVTLLFSRAQYLASAEAWLRGIERRIEAGRDPRVESVASVFVSRWDTAAASMVPAELKNKLGIAVAYDCYAAYREWLDSPRVRAVAKAGARPQRLLFASTGTKDPSASDVLYVEALAAPDTVDTIPEATLHAFADHGRIAEPMSAGDESQRAILDAHREAGVDLDALAAKLQADGAAAFVKSWQQLLQTVATKSRAAA